MKYIFDRVAFCVFCALRVEVPIRFTLIWHVSRPNINGRVFVLFSFVALTYFYEERVTVLRRDRHVIVRIFLSRMYAHTIIYKRYQ